MIYKVNPYNEYIKANQLKFNLFVLIKNTRKKMSPKHHSKATSICLKCWNSTNYQQSRQRKIRKL